MKLKACQIETAKPQDKGYKMADGMGYIYPTRRQILANEAPPPSHKKEDSLAFGVWHTCQHTILAPRWRLQTEESAISLLEVFYYTFASDASALDKGIAQSEKKRTA